METASRVNELKERYYELRSQSAKIQFTTALSSNLAEQADILESLKQLGVDLLEPPPSTLIR